MLKTVAFLQVFQVLYFHIFRNTNKKTIQNSRNLLEYKAIQIFLQQVKTIHLSNQ